MSTASAAASLASPVDPFADLEVTLDLDRADELQHTLWKNNEADSTGAGGFVRERVGSRIIGESGCGMARWLWPGRIPAGGSAPTRPTRNCGRSSA